MKLLDINKLGITQETVNDIELDIGIIITTDEFNKRGTNYRQSAVERLLSEKLDFTSNTNILHTLICQIMEIHCPICDRSMSGHGMGGNTDEYTTRFRCPECKLEISITLPTDGIEVKHF